MPKVVALIYDGECPFCTRYVRLINLRKTVGNLALIDAREGRNDTLVAMAVDRGLDLDQGMVLVLDGKFYHGSEAIQRLAMMSGPNGCFNRLNFAIFSRPGLSRVLYPVLRTGRNLTLRALRKPRLELE